MYQNYREIKYLGPCKSFVERSIYYYVPTSEGPLSEVLLYS